MAAAPTPGTTRPREDREPEHVTFSFVDGTPDERIDMRTITMRDRRVIKHALRGMFGEDVDAQEGLVGALWVHLRRTDPTVDLEVLFDRVSIVSFVDRATDTEAGEPEASYDNPEA